MYVRTHVLEGDAEAGVLECPWPIGTIGEEAQRQVTLGKVHLLGHQVTLQQQQQQQKKKKKKKKKQKQYHHQLWWPNSR
jgi:hypothetical protein